MTHALALVLAATVATVPDFIKEFQALPDFRELASESGNEVMTFACNPTADANVAECTVRTITLAVPTEAEVDSFVATALKAGPRKQPITGEARVAHCIERMKELDAAVKTAGTPAARRTRQANLDASQEWCACKTEDCVAKLWAAELEAAARTCMVTAHQEVVTMKQVRPGVWQEAPGRNGAGTGSCAVRATYAVQKDASTLWVTATRTIVSVDSNAEHCKAIPKNVSGKFSSGQLPYYLAGCVQIQLRP